MKPSKIPKAVKAWAIISPNGNIVSINFKRDSAWEINPNTCYLPSAEEVLKSAGYRAIRVEIKPL